MYNYKANDSLFDLQTVTLTKLKALRVIFKDYTINSTNPRARSSIQTFENSLEDYILFYVLQNLSITLHMQSLTEYLKTNYFHKYDPNVEKLQKMFLVVEEVFNYADEITKALKNVDETLNVIKQQNNVEFNSVFENHIYIFHETDYILGNAFRQYFLLQENFELLNFIFDQFEGDIILNAQNILLNDYLQRLRNYTTSTQFLWTFEAIESWMSMKQMIILMFYFCEMIIHEIINYKLAIANALKKAHKDKRLAPEVFNGCFSYFSRFYELYFLKDELTHNLTLRFTKQIGDDGFYNIQCYEGDVVPIVLRDCHRYIMAKKDQLNLERTSLERRAKDLVKIYDKSMFDIKIAMFLNFFFFCFLEPNTSFQVLSEFSVEEAFDSIKLYIQSHRDDFFPKRFRERFHKLANAKEYRTVSEDCSTLAYEFNKISLENQSKIVYIFDHIMK